MQQTDFFSLMPVDKDKLNISVSVKKEGDRFFATVGNGWYIGYGRTPADAVKSVLASVVSELEAHDQGL